MYTERWQAHRVENTLCSPFLHSTKILRSLQIHIESQHDTSKKTDNFYHPAVKLLMYIHTYIYIIYILYRLYYIYTHISFGTSRRTPRNLCAFRQLQIFQVEEGHFRFLQAGGGAQSRIYGRGGNTFRGRLTRFNRFLYSKQPTKQKDFWVKPRRVKLNGSLHSRCHWFWTNPKWYSLDGVGFDLIHPNNLHRRMYPVQSRFFWGKADNLVRPYIIIYLHCSWCYIATLWAIGSWLGWSNPAE